MNSRHMFQAERSEAVVLMHARGGGCGEGGEKCFLSFDRGYRSVVLAALPAAAAAPP